VSRISRFLHTGGLLAWVLIGAVVFCSVGSAALLARTADVSFRRDVSRMVYNDNLQLLDDIRRQVGEVSDTLRHLRESSTAGAPDGAYIVVSIADHRLWYKQGDSVLFTAPVATGSGKVLTREGGGSHWKFETPRGRLVVQSKDSAPAWVPPDWHYVESARKRGLGLVRLERGQSIRAADGSEITVAGSDVVRRTSDGRAIPLKASEGREIVVGGNIVIPPFGTAQRKYAGVLGAFRLNMGDGYALHGTDQPESIGRSVSHGCVRLRNADISALYHMVPVGTPVFIY
jgi:lipoprotein-anchoring transpeptidase ErfK/SrfK